MTTKILIFLILNILIYFKGFSQNNIFEKDTIGIRITQNKFDSLVIHYNDILSKHNKNLVVDDYITLVRIINTKVINFNDSFCCKELEKLQKLHKLFFPEYLTSAIKALKALPSKGLCFYSKQFDIFIGTVDPEKNSQFFIIGNSPVTSLPKQDW